MLARPVTSETLGRVKAGIRFRGPVWIVTCQAIEADRHAFIALTALLMLKTGTHRQPHRGKTDEHFSIRIEINLRQLIGPPMAFAAAIDRIERRESRPSLHANVSLLDGGDVLFSAGVTAGTEDAGDHIPLVDATEILWQMCDVAFETTHAARVF